MFRAISQAHAGDDPATWVHEMFARSIVDAVALRGILQDLEALEWEVGIVNGEIHVQGSPPSSSNDPIRICHSWAESLGMADGGTDLTEGVATWFLYDGPWLVEVYTPVS